MTEQANQWPGESKHAGGRPRVVFDLRPVEGLGKIQSTHRELAAVLGVSVDTVERRLQDDPEFRGAYERGLENGKSSLRRIQWKAALGGNTTMQIWLGRQYLGQRDQQVIEHTREEPVQLVRVVINGDARRARGEKEPIIEGGVRELPACRGHARRRSPRNQQPPTDLARGWRLVSLRLIGPGPVHGRPHAFLAPGP